MPLFKRKPYTLSQPPESSSPSEHVFQVRFTKEIFKDYQEYLKRINLYRKRVWTCKVTGKSNLTYEEALISERRATEKVQQFPKEFMGPVLNLVQFSVLRLDELINKIFKELKDRFVVGEEVTVVQGESARQCKILKIIFVDEKQEINSFRYEVGWLDASKSINRSSIESADTLIRKKIPFTRGLLKSFIRDSATNSSARGALWLVHDKLCHKYKIPTDPPEELKPLITKQEPTTNESIKRENKEGGNNEIQPGKKRRKKDQEGLDVKEEKSVKVSPEKVKPIQYPIDDSLVEPSPEDPPFTERPLPSSDFPFSMECVGRLLMVWSFLTSFGRCLHLSPFSLEDLEQSLEYKDGEAPLLTEATYALLRVLLSDPVVYQTFLQKRRRKSQVSFLTWKEDLCDFLEAEGVERFNSHLSSIRRGFKQLDSSVKLDILHELVDRSFSSDIIREQLDQYIEEKQAIAAQKRKEVYETVKEQQEQEHMRLSHADGEEHSLKEDSTKVDSDDVENGKVTDIEILSLKKNSSANGWFPRDGPIANETVHPSENGCVDHGSTASSRQSKLKLKAALKEAEEKEKQKKMEEEQKKIQERRKAQSEALKERKLQERKLIELQKRQEQLDREIEKRVIRVNPLGRDRNYNRYWFFPQEGRLFVESADSSKWGYYGAKEELDLFYGSLNPKGVRERALQNQMEKFFLKISDALQRRSKEIAQRIALEEASVRRSSRVKSTPKAAGFLTYVNKLRN